MAPPAGVILVVKKSSAASGSILQRVSVRKGQARLLAADGRPIGEGRAYLHLRQPEFEPQPVQGTLSLDWWDDALSTRDAQLELIDGPTLALKLASDRLSGCMDGRIIRYTADWPWASA